MLLSPAVADIIGNRIIKELGLKPNDGGLYNTSDGPKSPRGIARKCSHILKDECEKMELAKILKEVA